MTVHTNRPQSTLPYSHFAQTLATVPTPALLVDFAKLMSNVTEMAERARRLGVELWPHQKTHKSPHIAKIQLEQGASGVTVATIAEAELFVRAGCTDVLLAYPPVGAWRLQRLAPLAKRARIRVAVENTEVLRCLQRVCRSKGVSVEFLWEIDCGTGRLGLPRGAPSVDSLASIDPSPWTPFGGLMTFAGHVYAAESQSEVRHIAVDEAAALMTTAELLREQDFEVNALSAGTTPTAHHLDHQAGVTEVRPGNYVFYDETQVALGVVQRQRCALTVLTTVIARPDPTRIILDAGSKTLSAEQMSAKTNGFGHVVGHPELVVEKMYEEHAIARSAEPSQLSVGARVRVIPNHACAVSNLHQRAFVLEGDEIVDVWPIGVAANGVAR